MKIYTRGGDRGRTSLFSGERVAKSDARIEAYGDLDELNSLLGVVAAGFSALASGDAGERATALVAEVRAVQANLLTIGALLAATPGSEARRTLPPLPATAVTELEAAIDRLEASLPPLQAFLLPGGALAAAWAHVARCVCRRVERRVVALASGAPGEAGAAEAPDEQSGLMIAYLNRLSDYLFCLARTGNRLAGATEELWTP
jgi:cob(I)alamin adenosyltransferase